MRRRILGIALAAAMLLGGSAAIAIAEPGPNGKNDKGLCTAYFNGSEKGREKKRKAGPFAALEREADDNDPDTTPEEDVATYCEGMIGGKPDRRG